MKSKNSINYPKVSVVTVCFNAVDIIEETMLSVLNQTYDNIEYVIIDGCSKDGTVDIIKKYSARLAFWVSETDNGVYDAMNKAFGYSSGDYLIFLNAGDTFYNDAVIENIVRDMNGSAIIYGDVMMHFEDHHMEVYDGKFNRFKLAYKNICHQSIFYPKDIYKSFRFDLDYRTLADWVSNMQLWRKIKYKYVPLIISNYYLGGISNTQKDFLFEKERKKIIIQNLGRIVWIFILLKFYKAKIKNILIDVCH